MSKNLGILEIIERFNYSPSTIGYSALTKSLEEFALSYLKLGMYEAGQLIQKRIDDYDAEHGHTDLETGTREYPKGGDEYLLSLTELIEDITKERVSRTTL